MRPEYGKGLPSGERNGSGSVPMIGSAGVMGYHDVALVDGPVLVVGRKGNAGAVHLSNEPCWPIDTTYFLRVPGEIDASFAAFQISVAGLRALDSSTAIPSLRRPDLEKALLFLPPLAEQRRIVAAIEEQFSRLDAASHATATATARMGAFQTAVLGNALVGWTPVALRDFARIFVGATPSRTRPDFWHGTVPWVSSGEIAFNRIASTREMISNAAVTNEDRLHPVGTVLLAMIGEGRTRGQAAILKVPATHNQNSAAIRLDDARCLPEWLFYVFMARYQETRQAGSGGQQPALNRERVGNLMIPLPPLEDQRRIVAELEQQLSLIDSLRAAVESAQKRSAALRRAILERAFRGELVPQDPADEPASVLLERIRADRTAASSPSKRGAVRSSR